MPARILGLVAEPRTVTWIHTATYALLAVAAVVTLTADGDPILDSAHHALESSWSILAIVGSTLSAAGILPGIWWLERAGIVLCGTAVVMHSISTLAADLPVASSAVHLCFTTAYLTHLAVRGWRISGVALDPTRLPRRHRP